MRKTRYIRLSESLAGLIIAAFLPTILGAQESGKNYIMRTEYTEPDNTTSRREVSYFDGLGRLEQTVCVDGAGTGVDLTDLTEYDACGRTWRTWLPAGIPGNDGQFVSRQMLLQQSASVYGDGRAWSETEYDGSPLDRVRSQAGPGAAWAQAGRRSRAGYLTNGDENSDSLLCRRFYTVYPTSDTLVTVRRDGVWTPGSLTVDRAEDEDGRTVLTFKDLFGQTVLSRQVNRDAIGSERYLDTYYLYDEGGRLRAVLPPLLSSALSGDGVQNYSSSTSLAMRRYAYLYGYDERGRCFAKRLPGCGWIRYAYDKNDRPVLEEGPDDRDAGRVRFVLGDRHGRECIRGTCRNDFDSTAAFISDRFVLAERNWPSMRDTSLFGYSAKGIALSGPMALEVDYYDDYTFTRAVPQDSLFRQLDTAQIQAGVESAYTNVTGLRTGRLLRVLNLPVQSDPALIPIQGEPSSPPFLWEVSWYDEKGQPVETRRATHTGGMEQEHLSYRFTGEVASRTLVHHPGSGNPRREDYTYTYDLWSRPLETWHSWNYGNSVLIADRRYDGAGRLALDIRNGEPGLRTRYTYNVRSWLTGVSVGASDEADTGGAFTQRLYYNTIRPVTGGNTPQWAGNISGMDWQSSGTETLHRYDYGYDDLSRLVTALYDGPDGDGAYTETYAYDRHGNITEIRGGEGNGTGFEYDGNRMILVRALSAPTSGTNPLTPGLIPGNPSVVSPELPQEVHPRVLGYDSSGRLSRDNNQGVKAIRYNLLGLPSYVQSGHQENEAFNVLRYNASYGYSSDGVKLRRKRWTYRESGSPDQASIQLPEHFTDYVGSLVFEDNQLKTVLFEGGYVDATDGSRHFYITDHQGNIRAVTDATGTVEQANDYRPFGSEFDAASTGTNPGLDRRYGGKEKDAALPSSPFYDFEARMYNPVYARFTKMDPLAEKYYSTSPYAYCADDPVNLVDYTGMELSDYYSLKGKLLMHIDDGEDGKYFILNGSDVNTAINNGDIFPVPSGEVITKMSESFKATAKDGKERGFRVGNNGEASIIVTGSNTEITNEQWAPAVDDLRENHHTMVSYDVHTHPKDNNYSTNVPSETDKNNVVGHWPNVLLGYEHTVYSNTDFTGSTTVTHFDTPQIIFYNHTGVIGSPMDYSSFLKSVKRTNKN